TRWHGVDRLRRPTPDRNTKTATFEGAYAEHSNGFDRCAQPDPGEPAEIISEHVTFQKLLRRQHLHAGEMKILCVFADDALTACLLGGVVFQAVLEIENGFVLHSG